jgi:hypothetical protein
VVFEAFMYCAKLTDRNGEGPFLTIDVGSLAEYPFVFVPNKSLKLSLGPAD